MPTRLSRLSPKLQVRLLAVLSGLLYGLAFPPFGLAGGLLAFIALVPLLVALERGTRLRQAFARGWLAMFVLGIVSNYWVGGWGGIGHVDTFLMLAGVILAIVHPFFLVVPLLIYDAVRRRFGLRPALFVLPIVWTGFEYWHSLGDVSYPWLSLYNTQTYNLNFIQFIEFTGPYGLSFLIVVINCLVYSLIRMKRDESGAGTRAFVRGIILFLLCIIPLAYGYYADTRPETNTKKLTVSIIQPNINPWDKWAMDEVMTMDTDYASTRNAIRTAGNKPDLILWPETAITFFIDQPSRRYERDQLTKFIDTLGVPIVTGFPDAIEFIEGRDSIPFNARPDPRNPGHYFQTYNSAMLLYEQPEGVFHQEKYHKQKLVPLGEQVPFIDAFPILGKWFKWGVGISSWNKGEGHVLLNLPMKDNADTAKICTLICYESVYPTFVREFVNRGANLLFVITNDGWYGRSAGPYQHNQFAVLRAIENRRWIGRSANTGISSVIDDHGRFIAETPLFETASITMPLDLNTETTLYTRWGEWIAVPCMWLAVFAILCLIAIRVRERRKSVNLQTAQVSGNQIA